MIAHFILKSPEIRERAAEYVRQLPDKPVVEVTIKVFHKSRSEESNNFYWRNVVRPLSQHTGFSESEMHDEILGTYVGWELKVVRGHAREFPRRRTTYPDKMTTVDFMGLIQTGQKIAADLGVVLPDQEHDSCMT